MNFVKVEELQFKFQLLAIVCGCATSSLDHATRPNFVVNCLFNLNDHCYFRSLLTYNNYNYNFSLLLCIVLIHNGKTFLQDLALRPFITCVTLVYESMHTSICQEIQFVKKSTIIVIIFLQ